MANKQKKRNGVLVGAYVPDAMKNELKRLAAKHKMTLSQFLRKIFKEQVEK